MTARSSAELREAILAGNAGTANAVTSIGGAALTHSTVGAIPGSTGRSAGSGMPLSGQARGRRLAELNDFIPGPQTELALTAAKQVAAGQATMFNPLYVHGPVGTGKTHLLEGICRQLKRSQPHRRAGSSAARNRSRHGGGG